MVKLFKITKNYWLLSIILFVSVKPLFSTSSQDLFLDQPDNASLVQADDLNKDELGLGQKALVLRSIKDFSKRHSLKGLLLIGATLSFLAGYFKPANGCDLNFKKSILQKDLEFDDCFQNLLKNPLVLQFTVETITKLSADTVRRDAADTFIIPRAEQGPAYQKGIKEINKSLKALVELLKGNLADIKKELADLKISEENSGYRCFVDARYKFLREQFIFLINKMVIIRDNFDLDEDMIKTLSFLIREIDSLNSSVATILDKKSKAIFKVKQDCGLFFPQAEAFVQECFADHAEVRDYCLLFLTGLNHRILVLKEARKKYSASRLEIRFQSLQNQTKVIFDDELKSRKDILNASEEGLRNKKYPAEYSSINKAKTKQELLNVLGNQYQKVHDAVTLFDSITNISALVSDDYLKSIILQGFKPDFNQDLVVAELMKLFNLMNDFKSLKVQLISCKQESECCNLLNNSLLSTVSGQMNEFKQKNGYENLRIQFYLGLKMSDGVVTFKPDLTKIEK